MYSLRASFIPLLVTVLFHVCIVLIMVVGWEPAPPEAPIKKLQYVQAQLVDLKSMSQQKVKKEKERKVVDLAKKRKEKERQEKIADQKRKKEADQKRELEKKELARKDAKKKEDDKRKALELEKLKKLNEQKAFDQAMMEEKKALLEESYAVSAQSFMAAIAQRIEQNWSRPPSARNGMECELKIRLVPTGRVISVDIVRGSGNAQFDRSAEQAVKKVEQFPEVKEMKPEVFERYYRELTLVFRPQDLRQ